MAELQLIDTFPRFLDYWEEVGALSHGEQIEAWADLYMSHWPELRQMQIENYAEEGEDWRAIAREHVVPFLAERLPAMRAAHANLLNVYGDIYDQCRQTLGFDSDLKVVLYVGIGCGAGWAGRYQGKPAILFGLENIAEEGWQAPEAVSRLMSHELGHLVHFHWREQAGLADEEGPWWQLYTEGFAQWCEHQIQGQQAWHMQSGKGADWLAWCRENLSWMAAEFLRRVEEGEDVRPFFGSWHKLRGHKQTGYFLGHELIQTLCQGSSLREVGLLTACAGHLRPLLDQMARG